MPFGPKLQADVATQVAQNPGLLGAYLAAVIAFFATIRYRLGLSK